MPEAPVVLRIEDGRLRIDAPTGFDRASLLGAVDIPVAHIVGVDVLAQPVDAVEGWREGIGLPHLRMGTWRHDGVKDYVAVHTGVPGLVVTLRDEAYARLIVSIDEPEATARMIVQARDTTDPA